jgi:hypothetical protein
MDDLQTILFIDIETGEVLGAVLTPPCFQPNATFERAAEMIGVSGVLVDEMIDNPILLLTGTALMDAMRMAMATLN